MRVGFVGLGLMGQPMALRLVRTGHDVVVWNRTPERASVLVGEGATLAANLEEVFENSDIVLLMLANASAIDAVLDRGGPRFAARVARPVVVAMGTTSPESSYRLSRAISDLGGRYVEAPVSGSRPVAEQGQLIGMLAGESEVCALVAPVLEPLCREIVECGPIPRALHTKLAVNIYLIAMVGSLAEAWSYATRSGVDLDTLRRILDAGPMSSVVSRAKAALLAKNAFPAQATIRDVLYNSNLIREAANGSAAVTPLIEAVASLLEESVELGWGEFDMVAVERAYLHRAQQRLGAL